MTTVPLLRIQRDRHAVDVASGDVDRPSASRLKSRVLELGSLVGEMARHSAEPAGDEFL